MKSPRTPLQLPRLSALTVLVGACLFPVLAHAVVTLNPTGTTADRTSDINNAINSARAAGDYVMLNAGTYYHTNEITVSGAVELRGAGDTTILLSTNPLSATVRLTGTGPKLRNILVKSNYTGAIIANSPDRSQADLSALVYIKQAVGFRIENVTTEKSRGSGMLVTDSSGVSDATKAYITNCRVRDTLADGIHMTNGSKWIRVENCTNTNTGDDLIAVISKTTQTNVCTGITITDNVVSSNVWGRGITVCGGTNVTVRNNTITSPSGGGIRIASDSSYDHRAVSGIAVTNNVITNANAGSRGGQNGINIQGRYDSATSTAYTVSGVTVTGNTLTNSNGRGISIGKYTSTITLTDNKIDGTAAAGVEITVPTEDPPVPTAGFPKNITITGAGITTSYIKNTGAQGVTAPKATGALKIQNTGFEQINKTGDATANDVIRVSDCENLTVTITGNHYSNPSANGVQRYIECTEPTVTAPSPINTKAGGITNPSIPSNFVQ